MEELKEDKKEVDGFIAKQQKNILIFMPLFGAFFLFFGILMYREGDPTGKPAIFLGAVAVLGFFVQLFFRKKIKNRDVDFYNKNKEAFKFTKEITKAFKTYSSIAIFLCLLVIAIVIWMSILL
jgi:hypothetical protein